MRVLPSADLGGLTPPLAALESISMPQKQKSTQIIDGDAKQAAATLVEKLKFEARVL
jgi:electron transfer flavoprotein beta subunit